LQTLAAAFSSGDVSRRPSFATRVFGSMVITAGPSIPTGFRFPGGRLSRYVLVTIVMSG
jgi:hypothetical protein